MTSGDLRALALFFASLWQSRLNVFNASPQYQPSSVCLSHVLLYAPASINLPNTLSDNDVDSNDTSFHLLEIPDLHIAGHLTTEEFTQFPFDVLARWTMGMLGNSRHTVLLIHNKQQIIYSIHFIGLFYTV